MAFSAQMMMLCCRRVLMMRLPDTSAMFHQLGDLLIADVVMLVAVQHRNQHIQMREQILE